MSTLVTSANATEVLSTPTAPAAAPAKPVRKVRKARPIIRTSGEAKNTARSERAAADRPRLESAYETLRDSKLGFSASDVRRFVLTTDAVKAKAHFGALLDAFISATATNGRTLSSVSPDVSVTIVRVEKDGSTRRLTNANGHRLLSGFRGDDSIVTGGKLSK